jgi:hypothetical protein
MCLKMSSHVMKLGFGPDQAPRVSEEEKAGILEEEIMDSASRQCASSQCRHDEAVFSR